MKIEKGFIYHLTNGDIVRYVEAVHNGFVVSVAHWVETPAGSAFLTWYDDGIEDKYIKKVEEIYSQDSKH